ncbi:MAG TPA: PEGA domain-containing protein [Vicinamibacterales bacterium]|nr:PEGA domain-containing protein [Vicinamibacterales bacterium]
MLHQIGIGALGPVFRTYEPTRDRLVAVKVFRLDIVPEQAQALADALSRATESSLFHPSIVEPIAAGVEGTVAYRAEEYVAAESLDVAMRHYAPATLDKALPFITQLAGAIDFARAAGVGHGGLHPRDILVTPDEARATGFGVVEALEEVGIRAPTRRPYAAPERIEGAAWTTPADVFSLAAITFELLTGRRPSGTGTQIGTLPEGDHSAALHAVLARAMDDNPSKRYSSALAFAAALEAAGRGETLPDSTVAETAVPAVSLKPTPGELEVEKELDPMLAAIDADIEAERAADEADHAERSLFDEEHEETADAEDVATEALADLGEVAPERFADEFIDEQKADAEVRRPLEAVHETIVPTADAGEAPMYPPSDLEPDIDELGERSHILPSAVMLVIGLLIGFGAAWFLLTRERTAAPAPAASETAVPTPQPAPVAPGRATAEKPGQYSEQKVTPPANTAPAGTAPPSRTAPPPIPDETPARASGAPPVRRAEPAATRGRIVVKSTPARAPVTLNGKWRGRTPLTIDDLAFGTYVVRVVQPGYEVAREEFTLSARDASHEMNARLERGAQASEPAPRLPVPTPRPGAVAPTTPETFTGSLYVDSRPRGATVFVDGRSVGQTPLSVPEIAVGSHVVRLEMIGKKVWTTSTRVIAGQVARVTGSLDDK